MIVQSVHHNHSIECTLFFPWYSWWLYYDCDVHFVHSSAVSGKEQGTFDTMMMMSTLYYHQLYQGKNKDSIECSLFFPWYSWWLYKVYITIIVSNVPCSFPDTADECTKWTWCTLCTFISYIRERTRYIRYYDCDVRFVHSSAVSGKEQGTFDTMIVMYTL
jgi:hypothetical protein